MPGNRCMNDCAFCVSRMREDHYENRLAYLPQALPPVAPEAQHDYRKRLAFARDNGCNTVILTGIIELQ